MRGSKICRVCTSILVSPIPFFQSIKLKYQARSLQKPQRHKALSQSNIGCPEERPTRLRFTIGSRTPYPSSSHPPLHLARSSTNSGLSSVLKYRRASMAETPVARECFFKAFAYHDATTGGTLNAPVDRTTLMDSLTDSSDAASRCGGGTLGFRKLVIFRRAPKTPLVLTWDVLGSDCQYLFYIPLHSL